MAIDLQSTVQLYFPRIHRAALALCGDPWDADDLTQETFLVLSRQLEGFFEGRSSLYTYLYGILLNLERRERRRHGMRRQKLRVLWDAESPEDQTSPAACVRAEVSEWKKSLWSHVAELPDGQRQCLVLRFSEGLQYEEIAEIVGCPLGTVKSRIFHGLASVRKRMEQAGDSTIAPAHPDEDISHAV